MSQQTRERKRTIIWLAVVVATVAALIAVLVRRWLKRRAPAPPPARPPAPPILPTMVEGLTEAEAEARRLEGQDNVILLKPPRSKGQIWRENTYNIFNLNLLGLAFAQLLLGSPLNALLSLGTIALNIGLNIGQEMLARRRLREVEQAARPQATVIREERIRSIDPSEVVVGDVLVAGPGDQLLVDGEVVGEGQIVVDESALAGERARIVKSPGDPVYAGGFCIAGRAAYQAQKVGDERRIAQQSDEAPAGKEELTPLERTVERILWVLLVIVAIFTIMLLLVYFRIDTGIPTEAVNNAASVIFNIAPSSLFFMILLTYAAGTADLARVGALVHQARSVESLAQSTIVCFAKDGILTGTHVEIEPLEEEDVSESRLRQILGDYARTTSADNLAIRALLSTFEGSQRAALEEAPFLSAYGWSAIAFDDTDLRGIYVLGDSEILESPAATESAEPDDEDRAGLPLPDVRKAFAPVGRFFQRARGTLLGGDAESGPPEAGDTEENEGRDGTSSPKSQPASTGSASEASALADKASPADEALTAVAGSEADEASTAVEASEDTKVQEKPNMFRRLARRVSGALRRGDAEPEEEEIEEIVTEETTLLLAYYPDLVPLHDADRLPQLPEELIPLCRLRYSERVRPEAIDTIRTFSETGVGIKIFSSGAPEQTAAILRQAGLGGTDDAPLGAISGAELAELDAGQLARAAAENAIFDQLSPEQAGQVVAALRDAGESVAVVGDTVQDLPALRQASLAISRQSSTQAALSVADIVLLGDSPSVLSEVLAKGQRIANGLMDVLKLNLTQVFYLALLILGVYLAAYGFPYQSGQGTAVTVVTVALPSVGLSFWAAAGVLPRTNLGRLLARVVVPASITIAATALVVYLIFLGRTGEERYAQLTLAYTLIACGLLLVVLLRPPWQGWQGRGSQRGDWRPTLLSLFLLFAFFLVAAIPLAQELLKLAWLQQPQDYLVVGLATLAWALVLRFIWLIVPVYPRE